MKGPQKAGKFHKNGGFKSEEGSSSIRLKRRKSFLIKMLHQRAKHLEDQFFSHRTYGC
jgi:hypothetical protein